MKILVVASEAVPFVKTGGLGDVVGALPKPLARTNHQVKVFLPRYEKLNTGYCHVGKLGWSGTISINEKKHSLSVEHCRDKRLPLEFYFIRNHHFFDRDELYIDKKTNRDYADNDERFIFFTRGVLETVTALDWRPDIIHVHDWQASLIPVYVKTLYKEEGFFSQSKTVLTIHNLAYQGTFDSERFGAIGLPEAMFYATSPFEFYGKVNFLKAGIVYADKITTVSRRYAEEIQTDELGCGLNGVLSQRKEDLVGILNGVDYTVWSPSRDKKIPYTYHLANLSGKRMNKVELLRRFSLPVRDRAPLIGVISRLADQKGLDLFAEIADKVLAMDVQMIILGTGDDKYHQIFREFETRYPDKFRACLTFDDDLAHWIEAAADMFLMPSQFEPCGLNQMYSLKYGTVPIVREVGGLADTVEDFKPETGQGTGFVFQDYSPEALLDTITRAVQTFGKRRIWTKIMKSGMRKDYSWDRSAHEYAELFGKLNNMKND
ncbi:MAG: glycogen synthase GlgA [Candidatus Zixiibacteriota bacterium]|nr:MAG: glycogen synthase GlgA [candidate division Zixibacteria bacterium]